MPPNPSELLQSHAMAELSRAAGAFDVVFRAPPLLPVTDSALLAAQVDGLLLVARHGRQPGAVARRPPAGQRSCQDRRGGGEHGSCQKAGVRTATVRVRPRRRAVEAYEATEIRRARSAEGGGLTEWCWPAGDVSLGNTVGDAPGPTACSSEILLVVRHLYRRGGDLVLKPILSVRRHRAVLSAVFDVAVWVLTFVVSGWLRYDSVSDRVPWGVIALTGLGAGGLYLVLSMLTGLHGGRSSTGSLEQMMQLGVTIFATGGAVFGLNLVFQVVPRSIPAAATAAAGVCGVGAGIVAQSQRAAGSLDEDGAIRVLIVGAGHAGRELVGSMLHDAPPFMEAGGSARRRPQQAAVKDTRRPRARDD